MGSESSSMVTGSRHTLGTYPRRLLKSPGFRLLLESSRRAPRPNTPGASTRRASSIGWCGCSNRAIREGQTAPKSASNKGLGPAPVRVQPCGFMSSRPSETALLSILLPQIVGSGPDYWCRQSQEGQNAQVSANCPFLRILAQSRIIYRAPVVFAI